MKNFILLFLWSPIILQAQKGIKFEHNKTWGELIEQAKTENKYLVGLTGSYFYSKQKLNPQSFSFSTTSTLFELSILVITQIQVGLSFKLLISNSEKK